MGRNHGGIRRGKPVSDQGEVAAGAENERSGHARALRRPLVGRQRPDLGPGRGARPGRDVGRTFPRTTSCSLSREGPWRRSPPPCRTTSAVSPPTSSRTPWSLRWSRCACNVVTDPSTWCSPRTSRQWSAGSPLHPRRALPDEPRVVHPGGAGVLRRHPRPGPARPGRADVLAARGGPHPAAEPPDRPGRGHRPGRADRTGHRGPGGSAGGCGPRLLRPVGRAPQHPQEPRARDRGGPAVGGALEGAPAGRGGRGRREGGVQDSSHGRGGGRGASPVPGRCVGRGAGVALLPSRAVRLHVARRGVRAAPARGAALRLSGARQ